VGGGPRSRRPPLGAAVRPAPPRARAPARLRRAPAARRRGRRPRPRSAFRQDLRLPRRRAADPRGGAARGRRGRPDQGDERRPRRAAGRRLGPDRGNRRPARALARRRAGRAVRALARAARPPLAPPARAGARRAALEPRVTRSRLTSFLFLFALFCSTFENVAWGGAQSSTLYIADIPAALFVVAFAVEWWRSGERWIPGAAAVLIVFLAAFLLVDLIGFFNMETKQALDQFGKGIAKWLVHFLFIVAGVVYLARRSRRYFWRAFGWFTAGGTVRAVFGRLQLLSGEARPNLGA